MKCVISVLGKDTTGIVAKVATTLLECGANIDDISQTLLGDIFSMTMMVTLKPEVADFNTAAYQYGQTCNYTKATPCVQADILGDWREELIMWNYKDPSEIMIYTTAIPTTYRVPTLMHDHTYRMGICWQNTAYNQPPHLGYYLPDYIDGKLTGIRSLESGDSRDNTIDWTRSDLQIYDLQGRKIPTDSRLLTLL